MSRPREGAIPPYEDRWEDITENPFAATLASGVVLSYDSIAKNYPETLMDIEKWLDEKKKVSEPMGEKSERVVLFYSRKTTHFKRMVAEHIAKLGYYVLTAPFIYKKGTADEVAFQPYPKESLNDFLKRMLFESQFAVILYTIQGGQIIETSWCSDSLKPTLGLVAS